MKKQLIILISLILLGCSRSDNVNNCNFLLNVGVDFNFTVNSGPTAQLINPGIPVKIDGFGNGGIILMRTNSETIRAWDGADPNHPFANCSILTINGQNAICGCEDENEYNLFTGQTLGENQQPCTLFAYRVDAIGNGQFRVSNF